MTHPKYGERYTCFQCGAKFYDLKKPEPLCPKCGVDQRTAPKKASPKPAKQPAYVKDYVPEEEGFDEGEMEASENEGFQAGVEIEEQEEGDYGENY